MGLPGSRPERDSAGDVSASYTRAHGVAAVLAAVAGAASQTAEDPLSRVLAAIRLPVPADSLEGLSVALEAAFGPDLLIAEREILPGWLLVTAAEHCSCCGHRYGGGHVRVEPCPCESREAWEGRS